MSRPLSSKPMPGRAARIRVAALALGLTSVLTAAPLHVLKHESDGVHAVCSVCSVMSGLGAPPCVAVPMRPVLAGPVLPLAPHPDARIAPPLRGLRVRAPPSA